MRGIIESGRRIDVVDEVDVIVAGGGIAGVAAAVSAARCGVNVALIERNGFLGGVATAGLMCSIGNRFFIDGGEMVVRGVAEEAVGRLSAKGGTGSGWINQLVPKIPFDPEIFKLVLDEMVEEAGVHLYLYSHFANAIRAKDRLRGVIIEDRTGREAIEGSVTVDCTGDADVAARAGAPFEHNPPGSSSLEFRMANVDLQRAYEFFKQNPERYPSDVDAPRSFGEFEWNWLENGFFYYPHGGGSKEGSNIAVLVEEAVGGGDYVKGFGLCSGLDAYGMDGLRASGTIIINSNFERINELDTRLMSKATCDARKACFKAAGFLKDNLPGFENSFIVSTAQELGVRVTRHIVGEHVLTREDANTKFFDVIGVGSTGFPGRPFEIPYRCMLPKKVEGLIVASGKAVSTRPGGYLRGMTTCMVLGQAAGVAAALVAKQRATARKIDVRGMQSELLSQKAYLGNGERLKGLDLSSP